MNQTSCMVIFLVIIAVLLSISRRRPPMPREDYMQVPKFLKTKPKLYVFYDSEQNARHWWDFGARNSDLPNRGYTQVAHATLVRTQGADFDIVPLVGRKAVLDILPPAPSAEMLPPALWRVWTIANICAKHGGLVMDGNSTLCVGPSFLPVVQPHAAAVFGVHPDEPVVSPATAVTPGPAPYVGWSATPGNFAWESAAKMWNELLKRGPQAWTAAIARRADLDVFESQRADGISIIRAADGSRLATGKLRDLEDYFGRVSVPADPAQGLLPGTVYVAYDGDALARRYEFQWFVRLSPTQIADSDILWARLAGVN